MPQSQSNRHELIRANVEALEEGLQLLLKLDATQYTQGYKPAFHSTIGAHFRHVLEHYRCFIKQLPSGTVSYDSRERDQRLERDFAYCQTVIVDLQEGLQDVSQEALQSRCKISDSQSHFGVETTVLRELLFLQAHTMHHYAIIGAMARALGAMPDEDFGVAIATREHQQSTMQSVTTSRAKTCAR